MVRVARFEKVSLRRFVTDWVATFPQHTVEQAVAHMSASACRSARQAVPLDMTSLRRSVLNSARAKASKFRRGFGC